MKLSKFRSVDVPLFTGKVYLVTTMKEYNQLLKHVDQAKCTDVVAGKALFLKNYTTGECNYIVGVFNGSIETLVHELAHITFFILNEHGVSIQDGQTNETYCYLLGSLFNSLKDYINESKR